MRGTCLTPCATNERQTVLFTDLSFESRGGGGYGASQLIQRFGLL